MNTFALLVLVGVSALSTEARADTDEPNWSNRYMAIKADFLRTHPIPTNGQVVTVMTPEGASLTGPVEIISPGHVRINGVVLEPRLLTDQSRDILYPTLTAISQASEQVLKEQAEYKMHPQQKPAWMEAEQTHAKKNAVLASTDSGPAQNPALAPSPSADDSRTNAPIPAANLPGIIVGRTRWYLAGGCLLALVLLLAIRQWQSE